MNRRVMGGLALIAILAGGSAGFAEGPGAAPPETPVKDLAEAFEDGQVRHREMVFEAEVPGAGNWRHVGNPIKMSGAPGKVHRLPPPGLGEHTNEVLLGAGLSKDAIEELRAQGAI